MWHNAASAGESKRAAELDEQVLQRSHRLRLRLHPSVCPLFKAARADIAWADAVKYAVVRTLKEYGGAESVPLPILSAAFWFNGMILAGKGGFITRTTYAPVMVLLL
jgi:hypothetical protein